MRLFIDNQLITGRVEGLKNLSVTYNRKGEGGEPSVSFSNELQIYDDGYNLIKSQLIDATSGRLNTLDVKIFDDCCEGAIFEGKITGTTIEWCEDECYITTQVIQNDSTAKQLQCLRSTLVTDDSIRDSRGRSFTQRNYPAFSYCNEVRPQFIHDLLIVYGIIQEAVYWITIGFNFSIVFLVVKIVAFLVKTFGDLFDIETPDIDKYVNAFRQAIQAVRSLIVGCGRSHPTPMVRDYIDNVCKACGLQFESSILNDVGSPYYTLAYLNAPIKKGNNPLSLKRFLFQDFTDNTLIEENLPFVSGIDFLEQMKAVFNADYKIQNDTLVFETVTDIEAEIWKSSSDLSITDGICYTWSGDEKEPASGKFSYAQDGVDVVGDEALGRYNDIVSWQGFANQEGIEETNLLFGAARFRDDGIDRDVISFWNDKISFIGLGDIFSVAADFRFSLLMEKGRTTFPKLILWDGDNFNNAKAIRVPVTGFQDYRGNGIPFNLIQNYPMFFDSEKSGNLYDRFHYLKDPRTSVQRNKNYEFTATIDCNDISDFDITKNIGLPDNFVGTMETVTINYSNRTITINGKV